MLLTSWKMQHVRKMIPMKRQPNKKEGIPQVVDYHVIEYCHNHMNYFDLVVGDRK